VVAPAPRRQAESSTSSRRKTTEAKKPEPPKKKEPEVDLFSFDDPIPVSAPVAAPLAASTSNVLDDDDFDDFQSATPQPAPVSNFSIPQSTATTTSHTQYAAPQPVSGPKAANLTDLVGFSSISPAPSNNTSSPANYGAFAPPMAAQQPSKPTTYQGSQPNYFTSVQVPSAQQAKPSPSIGMAASKPAAAKSSGGDAFGSLWSTASVGIKKTSTPTTGPALGQLAKEKASAGIWGASSSSTSTSSPQYQQQKPAGGSSGNGLDDLLG
jgi:epsin